MIALPKLDHTHILCASGTVPLEVPMMRERVPRKRAVNLFVDTELLDEARRLEINISETLERRLRSIVKAEQEKAWLRENETAIASINGFIEQHGLLASRLRFRP
jgi:antitoxin CcdA